jgi:HEPN domain-containing protein
MEPGADWLARAQGDLAHARHDVAAGFYDWACFSAQQAAEKATKAVFQRLGADAWGHSVADLLEELRRTIPVPDVLVDAGQDLDRAYIAARYPNAHPSGSPRSRYFRVEAERLVTHAEAVVRFCEGLLPTL